MSLRNHLRSAALTATLTAAFALGLTASAGCYNVYYLYGETGDLDEIQVHVPDPAPDYTSYVTYAFNTPDMEVPESMKVYEDEIKRELRENMDFRGFVFDADAPDFVFNIFANIDEGSSDFNSYYCDANYTYYYPCEYYDTISYGIGTLVIGLVDAESPETDLWSASIEGVFFEGAEEDEIIRRLRNNIDVAFDLSPGGLREGTQ